MNVLGRGVCMPKNSSLAEYIEELWERGFKLSDEEVRFIYFGKRYTEANDQIIILALKFTLQIQRNFDRSFYISLLELFLEHLINTEIQAIVLLRKIELI